MSGESVINLRLNVSLQGLERLEVAQLDLPVSGSTMVAAWMIMCWRTPLAGQVDSQDTSMIWH